MLGWLGIDLWMEGGLAFNPGYLTALSSTNKQEIQGFRSHAEFEKECKRCHQPFAGEQASLCLDLRKKQLFWDSPDSVGRDDESKRIYWAVG